MRIAFLCLVVAIGKNTCAEGNLEVGQVTADAGIAVVLGCFVLWSAAVEGSFGFGASWKHFSVLANHGLG